MIPYKDNNLSPTRQQSAFTSYSILYSRQTRLEVLNAQVQENVGQNITEVAKDEEITQISLRYALDVENIGMAIARKLVNNNTISIKTSDIGLLVLYTDGNLCIVALVLKDFNFCKKYIIDSIYKYSSRRGSRSTPQQYGGECTFLIKGSNVFTKNSIGNLVVLLDPRMSI